MKEKNEFEKHQAAKKYYDAGQALALCGRAEEAIIAFDKAIALYPTSYLVEYQKKGRILQDLRRYDEALSMYDQALSCTNINIFKTQTIMLSKVEIYIEQKKWDLAEAILKDQRLGEVWEVFPNIFLICLYVCA